jgi:hypothetical protein
MAPSNTGTGAREDDAGGNRTGGLCGIPDDGWLMMTPVLV